MAFSLFGVFASLMELVANMIVTDLVDSHCVIRG